MRIPVRIATLVYLSPMTPLTKHPAGNIKEDVAGFDIPVEKLTESILALSDAAVIITQRDAISYCTHSIVSVLGINRETVMERGWPYLVGMIHPADARLLRKKVLPEVRKHYRDLTPAEKDFHTFNFTVRIRTEEADCYALIAVENRPLRWHKKDWPTSYISVIRDISPFGNTSEMQLNVYHHKNKSYSSVLERRYSFASERFSARETEIIRLVARGMTSIQIAGRLSISPETVRNHRKKIMRKAGCNSSSALTSLAIQEGII